MGVAFCFDVVLSKKEKGLVKKAKSLKATSHDKPPRRHGHHVKTSRTSRQGRQEDQEQPSSKASSFIPGTPWFQIGKERSMRPH